MTRLIFALLFIFCFSNGARASTWPDAPWINGSPQSAATVSALAFVSPYDLQFYRLASVWKRLQKKYSALPINFLMVMRSEEDLPVNDQIAQALVKDANYSLPVLIDANATYSKLWRAYVTPTVNLVLKDGHVTSFDPGNFDPAGFEKALQRLLKESGVTPLPAREFVSEGDLKNCGHAHTLFLGEKFLRTTIPNILTLSAGWASLPLGQENKTGKLSQVDLNTNRNGVGLLAESLQGGALRVNVTLDGQKIPTDLRGKDLQEDKVGTTFVMVRGLKMYEALNHHGKDRENPLHVSFASESKGLRLRALETIPSCLEN